MYHRFQVMAEGKCYAASAVVAAHTGRAVLISLIADGAEMGLVKLISPIPEALLNWGQLDEAQFLHSACLQFLERELAREVLSSSARPLVLELE